MQKGVLILTTILLASMLAAPLIAAQELPAPGQLQQDLISFFESLLTGSGSDDILVKILVAVLLGTLVFRASEKIFDQKQLSLVIAIAVSIIAIRGMSFYLSKDFLNVILLPYSVLGLVLSTFLPIIIFGALLETSDMPRFVRKSGWLLFTFTFFFLWILRYGELGNSAYFYFGSALLCAFIFIFEEKIYNMRLEYQLDKVTDIRKLEQVEDLQNQLAGQYAKLASASGIEAEKNAEHEIKRLKKKISRLLSS